MTTYLVSSTGLMSIFIMALFLKNDFKWIIGVAVLLMILFLRTYLGEIRQKTELLFSLIAALASLGTIFYIIIKF
jgi:hypothetical protein